MEWVTTRRSNPTSRPAAAAISFNGVTMAAKLNEDAAQPLWGQGFRPAAELPLGAERHVSAGSAGDLVAGPGLNRVFNGSVV